MLLSLYKPTRGKLWGRHAASRIAEGAITPTFVNLGFHGGFLRHDCILCMVGCYAERWIYSLENHCRSILDCQHFSFDFQQCCFLLPTASRQMGVVVELKSETREPVPAASGHPDGLGSSEGRDAVHQCDAYLDFGSHAIWVSGADAFAKGLEAPHHRPDPASGVVSGPALPECPAIVSGWLAGFRFGQSRLGQYSFRGRPFLQIGMIAVACRSMIAVWQQRVS